MKGIKLIIEEYNKISKWIIMNDISFIGHEWTDSVSLFNIIHKSDFIIHLELMYFEPTSVIITVLNCYKNKNHILSISDTTENCLIELGNMK